MGLNGFGRAGFYFNNDGTMIHNKLLSSKLYSMHQNNGPTAIAPSNNYIIPISAYNRNTGNKWYNIVYYVDVLEHGRVIKSMDIINNLQMRVFAYMFCMPTSGLTRMIFEGRLSIKISSQSR